MTDDTMTELDKDILKGNIEFFEEKAKLKMNMILLDSPRAKLFNEKFNNAIILLCNEYKEQLNKEEVK